MSENTIQFSTILASTVHDMKNALGVIMNTVDELSEQLKHVELQDNNASLLRYETSRLNGQLMQLLALYKVEQNQLPVNINYHNVYDFLEEQVLNHEDLLKSKNIKVKLDVDESLEWLFDIELLAIIIHNILSNAIRYTLSEIVLEACIKDDNLNINVVDNGEGFPEMMIQKQNDVIIGIDQSTGSTGLGIYFAAQVAALHQKGDIKGRISISNNREQGGNFSIWIP